MPLLWTSGVNTGRLTKEEFVAVTSANIARILNIYPRKGRLGIGSDADIVVWDPAASKTISAKSQVSRIDYNVFEEFACPGRPRRHAVARQDRFCQRRSARREGRRKICRAAAVLAGPCRQFDLEAGNRTASGAARGGDAVRYASRAHRVGPASDAVRSSLPGPAG